MSHYNAPLDNIYFLLFDTLKANRLTECEGFEDATEELLKAVIEEAAKLAEQVLLPVNAQGDREGCTYNPESHSVTTPSGFKDAYKHYIQGGWSGLSASPEFGGQGLPHLLKMIVDEMVCSTNLSFGMYPGLSHGAIDCLTKHGNDHLQKAYLPKLITGEWTGTMCLTEPQCGTDLGLINTKATPDNDVYKITGTKIWITGGENDLVDNIVHLVLAKLPDAPEGSRGISLFLVPKILENGERNTVFCGGLEHKMGINGSATCVMNFEDATGWLIGEPNQGLKCMFTMMNAARIMVGIQGLGLAETAYQVSRGFAKERLQSRSLDGAAQPNQKADPIIVHPDVRRMLLRQKAIIEGSRAIAYWTGLHLDYSHSHPESSQRERSDDIVQLMTPIVKSFLTDEGFASCDQALQSMGGAGFTQDWPVEQLLRDGRISRIYEGTNGIQALDLVGRKLTMHNGRLAQVYLSEMKSLLEGIANKQHLATANRFIEVLQETLGGLVIRSAKDPIEAAAIATPLLRMFALTTLAVLWAKMANQTESSSTTSRFRETFLSGKRKTADHFYRLFYPEMIALAEDVKAGKESLMTFSQEEF
ncbi:acyl-CoA dehydrogenase family protein [Alkalimarinus coralli]|uniref:acyl-CoA dehydrogenase family protein n=1 Tax=Alkalimarinus coralli TaxID=2935863 RepID=UPI00202BA13A|nr:acyl-CoA dehydrogenase family protein [Alkalimarinus coralli]